MSLRLNCSHQELQPSSVGRECFPQVTARGHLCELAELRLAGLLAYSSCKTMQEPECLQGHLDPSSIFVSAYFMTNSVLGEVHSPRESDAQV